MMTKMMCQIEGGDNNTSDPPSSTSPFTSSESSPNTSNVPNLPNDQDDTASSTLSSPPPSAPPSPNRSPPPAPRSPDPPHQSQSLAPRCQPMYRKDGLIEPLPNSGRGHKRVKATRQSARVPWNYNGPQWPPPSTVPEPLEPENPSSSEAAGLESEDDLVDDPVHANSASLNTLSMEYATWGIVASRSRRLWNTPTPLEPKLRTKHQHTTPSLNRLPRHRSSRRRKQISTTKPLLKNFKPSSITASLNW
ncbi:hypothetical protein HGRIS_011586 [Hohenbuehelia grisea]|uniref:Uncharacterized protein n=1 Tax=Hohenbuehelia grisea TaxID=104357 RepID=A0ABR3JXT1_9AGAR